MTVVWIALDAVVGGPLRYLVDRAIRARRDSVFPWGTLSVNVVASLVLGAVLGAGVHTPQAVSALVGQLAARRASATTIVYLVASLPIGIGAPALGWRPGRALG